MTEQICENCKFWERWQCQMHFGSCHRYPKRYESNGKWPAMFVTDWCGEYKKQEDKSPLEKHNETVKAVD